MPFSIAMLAWGISQPLIGAMLDARGTRPIILTGIVLTALGFIAMSVSQELWHMSIAFGLLIGVSISATGSISFAVLISKWFTGARRGSAVGVVQAAVPASPMLLSPVIFLASVSFGWRFASLGFGLFLLLVTLPLAYWKLHDPRIEAIAASGPERHWGWREILKVIQHPPMRNLFIARFACGLSFLMIPILATLAIEYGLTPVQGALAVSVYGGSSALGSVLGGMAADRYGRVRTLVITYLLRGIGAIALGLFTMDVFWFYLAVVVAAGPIFATVSVNNVQAFEMVGGKSAGLILGLGIVLHQIAAAIAPYASGVLFELTDSYRVSFLALGILLLLAMIPAARTQAEPINFD